MNAKSVKVLRAIFFLSLGAVLLYFAYRGISLKELMQDLKHAKYGWVALSLVLAILALIFRAYRWQLLIEPLGGTPKVVNIFHAVNIGYLANFVFPRIGEITRCASLNRTDKIPINLLLGTVIVERTFDLLMAFICLGLLFVLRVDLISDLFVRGAFQSITGRTPGLIGIAVVCILFVVGCYFFYKIFREQLVKIAALRKIKDLIKGILNGVKSIKQMKKSKLFILLNILIYLTYFLQTYTLFQALDSTSGLNLGDALFIFVASTLSFIIPAPGGIGAYHWAVSVGLMVLGLTREEGLAYATLSHSATSIVLIILGTISLILVFYSGARKIARADHTNQQ